MPCKLGRGPIETVTTPNMAEFSKWIDDYVRQFPEMMTGLPEILATVPADEHAAVEPKPSFAVGDKVTTGTITGQIENIVEDEFMVKYTEGTRTKVRRFTVDQLTKVGGRHRRKSRKRIR